MGIDGIYARENGAIFCILTLQLMPRLVKFVSKPMARHGLQAVLQDSSELPTSQRHFYGILQLAGRASSLGSAIPQLLVADGPISLRKEAWGTMLSVPPCFLAKRYPSIKTNAVAVDSFWPRLCCTEHAERKVEVRVNTYGRSLGV
jgi:hypothetical protein